MLKELIMFSFVDYKGKQHKFEEKESDVISIVEEKGKVIIKCWEKTITFNTHFYKNVSYVYK